MPGPRGALSVRISDGETDRMVTRHVTGLGFSKVAPGGHQELTFTLTLPRDSFRDLGPEDRVWVYDTRTGRCVFDGYLENPTPTDGPNGQQYSIRAVGGMALANDESRALVYLTRDMSAFETAVGTSPSSNVDTGPWVNDESFTRIRVSFGGGAVVAPGSVAEAGFYVFDRADMNLGGFRIGQLNSGKADLGYTEELISPTGAIVSRSMNTAGANSEEFVGLPNFDTGVRRIALQLRRVGGATNVADDQTWTDFVDFSAIGQRMNRYGTLLTGPGQLISASTVRADQVVEDLLGRLLHFCDPSTARVDATSFPITQLSWTDGIKAAGVMNELANFEPDFTWEILESGANGLHRFNYRAWPTEPRYEVSVKDGWVQSGSDVDLCNRILVTWTDPIGKTQTTEVTAVGLGWLGYGLPVDDLGDRVKDAEPITLPDGYGSLENALRIGTALLRDSIDPPKAGQVVVRRPIFDRLTGNWVMPWEFETGYVASLRETGDELRITELSYADEQTATTLTLGRPVLTRDQRLARLDAA